MPSPHRYQISYLADSFDLLGDLSSRQFRVLGRRGAAQLGDTVVYLDVHPRHLRGARVLTDVGSDALFYLLLLLAYTLDVPMLLADQGPGRGVRVISLGAGAVRIGRALLATAACRPGRGAATPGLPPLSCWAPGVGGMGAGRARVGRGLA